eukprot:m.19460 g.19460  ORF g.19460 m.19460 type:complete len:850 (+) comp27843_c0_seq3:1-2550(+)
MELPRIPQASFSSSYSSTLKDTKLYPRTSRFLPTASSPNWPIQQVIKRQPGFHLTLPANSKRLSKPRPLGVLPKRSAAFPTRGRAESLPLPLPLPMLDKAATNSSPMFSSTKPAALSRRAKTENFRVAALGAGPVTTPLAQSETHIGRGVRVPPLDNDVERSTEADKSPGMTIKIDVKLSHPVDEDELEADFVYDDDVRMAIGAVEQYVKDAKAARQGVPKQRERVLLQTKYAGKMEEPYGYAKDPSLRLPEKSIYANSQRSYFSFINQKAMSSKDKWELDKRGGIQWIPCARCIRNGGRCRRCICIRVGGGYIILDDAVNGSDYLKMTEEERKSILASGVFAKEPTCSRCHSAVLSRGRMDRPMSGVIDPSGRHSSMSRKSDESDMETSRRLLGVGAQDDSRSSLQNDVGLTSGKRSPLGGRKGSGFDESKGKGGAFGSEGGTSKSKFAAGDGRSSRLEDVAETEDGIGDRYSALSGGMKSSVGEDASGSDEDADGGMGDCEDQGGVLGRKGRKGNQNFKKGRKARTTAEEEDGNTRSGRSLGRPKTASSQERDSDDYEHHDGDGFRRKGEVPPVGHWKDKEKRKTKAGRHRELESTANGLPPPPERNEYERGRLRELQRNKNEASALKCTLKDLEGIDPLDYLAKYCIISPERLPHYERSYLNVARDEEDKIDLEQLDFALKAVNYDLITDSEMGYISHVLELPGRRELNFKLFACVAALSERVVGLEPMVKNLIHQMNFAALDYKLRKCKELFYLLASENEAGVVTSSALAIELHAGGLTKEHEDYVKYKALREKQLLSLFFQVVDRLDKEKNGCIEFLDYLVYVPLFVEIHDSICGNPFEFSRTK